MPFLDCLFGIVCAELVCTIVLKMYLFGIGVFVMHLKRQKQSESGFTIVEVIVVVAIIAMIAAISAPSLLNWKRKADLDADMRRLYGFFQKARYEAVSRNDTSTVVLTPTTYVLSVGGENIYTGAFENGVTSDADPNLTRTYSRRGLINSAATITLTGITGYSHQLVINIRGRMRVE